MNDLLGAWKKHKVSVNELEEGVLEIGLLVKPGSKKEKIYVGPEGEVIVAISKRPVQGQANQAVVKSLGKKLGLAPSYLEIKSGAKSKIKVLRVTYNFNESKDETFYVSKVHSLFGA